MWVFVEYRPQKRSTLMFVRLTFPILVACLFFGTTLSAHSPVNDLLSGPSIQDEEVTDQDMLSRRLQETGKSASLDARQQLKFWMTALESVDKTQKQRADIQAIVNVYLAKQHEFQKMYGTEISNIRKEQRTARQNGITPTEESRKRMMEVLEFTPDPTTYQEQAWDLLTPEQQQTFRTTYQSILAEELKKREARKANDRPEMDVMLQPDTDRKPETGEVDRNRVDRQDRNDNFDNSEALRRIRFLRRMRELQSD